MIRAIEADRAEIEAFLTPVSEYAMFPLGNLRLYGMAGGHHWALSFWITRVGGEITDVLTVTDGGMVFPYLPSRNFAAAAAALRGLSLLGIIGPANYARGLQAALGLTDAATTLDGDEPHFLLSLDDLQVPDGPGQIVPLVEAPAAVIRDWMYDYEITALQTPPDKARAAAEVSFRPVPPAPAMLR